MQVDEGGGRLSCTGSFRPLISRQPIQPVTGRECPDKGRVDRQFRRKRAQRRKINLIAQVGIVLYDARQNQNLLNYAHSRAPVNAGDPSALASRLWPTQ
ncbi:hypothetical protein EFD56_27865 [Rhizobium phaseoli]|nr:hypothetical protein EFD56_27865 [Rhizobium phaseoli]